MAIERRTTPNGKCVETHKLVLAYGDGNNNKFWTCKLYDSGDLQCVWGRIGDEGDNGVHRSAGIGTMLKLMKDKQRPQSKYDGQAYREVQVLDGDFQASNGNTKTSAIGNSKLKEIAKKQIVHSSAETGKLIEWLAEINRHQISDATGGKVTWNADSGLFQTPLGIVTPDSISQARTLLGTIGDCVSRKDWVSESIKRSLNDYLMLIPHDLGRKKWSPATVFPSLTAVQSENSVLDSLDASYISATSSDVEEEKQDKKEQKVFETKLEVVSSDSVLDMIRKKYDSSVNRSHYGVRDLKVKKAWEVEVSVMVKAFESISKRIGNVMDLWHGTKASNLLSILKVGLVIPPASSPHCTGRMFGDGAYFSDQSTKALNYATSFWGGRDIGRYFMFLAKVAMGKTYIPGGSMGRRCPLGYDSTYAKAGQSGVLNNEMIVYSASQSQLVYLVEFGR
jgi:poly [ADP-ribose] polymerase 2/3/4